jgi:hypothetical protein
MSDRIEVPEGMRKAVQDKCADYCKYGGESQSVRFVSDTAIEAALLWQRENVHRPTDYQFGELVTACRESIGKEAWEKSTEWMRAGILCHEWVRRMYDAPALETLEDTDVMSLINKRMAEYQDWLSENLNRASKGVELLPRLSWDKPGRKLFTYADVVKPKQ